MIKLNLHYWIFTSSTIISIASCDSDIRGAFDAIPRAPPENGLGIGKCLESWGSGPSEASFETSEIVRNGAA
jgi:hypothetical protein